MCEPETAKSTQWTVRVHVVSLGGMIKRATDVTHVMSLLQFFFSID